jgi:hypothetical protein
MTLTAGRSPSLNRKAFDATVHCLTGCAIGEEITDNAVVLGMPGAMAAGLADFLFWGSLALGLAVAFVIALPVNRWSVARGLGHAATHAHHP